MTYDFDPEKPPEAIDLPQLPGDAPKKPPAEIEEDLECTECGYNLRGLTRHHRCPECGTPASFSTSGNRLAMAPSSWLKKVSYGLLLIMGSVCLYVMGLFNVMLLSSGLFLDLVGAAMAGAGVFLLTSPEHRAKGSESLPWLGIGLRVVAGARIGFALTAWLSPSATLGVVALAGSQLSALGLVVAVAVFIRSLAQRMDDYELDRSTWQVAWGLSLCVVVFLIASLLAAPLAGVGTMAPYCTMLVTATLTFAAVIWFLVLLLRYYNAVSWAVYQSARKGEPRPTVRLDLLQEEQSRG